MPKYLDPKNDIAFKKVFVENKDLMNAKGIDANTISELTKLTPDEIGRL